MEFSKLRNRVFALCLFAMVTKYAHGHSFLIDPEPYNRLYEIGVFPNGCKPFQCPACPNLANPRSQNKNLPERPAATWRRGQTVKILWAKNNHWGGFVRLSIVPVPKMFDHVHQKRLAFYFGCWQQNVRKCTPQLCGSDRGNNILSRDIEIPAVIPDGVYAFSWVWYGGVHFKQDKPKFPDYYSCSFVRIMGGVPLRDTYQPFFDDGDGGKIPGTCRVGFSEPGKCTQVKQCENGPVFDTVPTEFQNGNRPAAIAKEMYVSPYPTTTPNQPNEKSSFSPMPSSTPVYASISSTTPTASPFQVSAQPSMSLQSHGGNPPANPGRPVCSGAYCCPAICGKCGGAGCSARPGGYDNCCVRGIINAKRYCERDDPPCKRS